MYDSIHNINHIQNLTFQRFIDIARNNLTEENRIRPWTILNHGIGLLNTEDELNCYLAAYGNMHEAKIQSALSSIGNPHQVFDKDFEIIDWGCGQGLATACFIDYLNENKIPNKIQKITLIEPSNKALSKAKLILNSYVNDKNRINTINKYIDNVELSDIKSSQNLTINFFSNILDITTINLKKLANLVSDNINGEHYFICVGPLNLNSTRIDCFANHLNISEKELIKHKSGNLLNTRGTIKLLVFRIKGQNINVIKTDYYPQLPIHLNFITTIETIMKKITPNDLSPNERIIQFYKSIVELEQKKEPEISELFKYPMLDTQNNIASIDLSNNKDFVKIFKNNIDEKKTKLPKDLFIGLEISLNNKTYIIMNYIIPYSDIKNIRIDDQKIPWKFSDFSINNKAFEKLEFSEDQINRVEDALKEQSTFQGLISVFKSNIDNNIVFSNELSLGLSSKSLALSQVNSELGKINKSNIIRQSLLECFLSHSKFNNTINNYSDSDLIQICDMDETQKIAVTSAFNNRLSVITGPPGSGKTQVILNILANAVLLNKKVLVASKNNKAVDNVKDRFDLIDDTGFFLRFGSKNVLGNTTIPAIQKIIDIIPTQEGQSSEVKKLMEQMEIHRQSIKKNESTLEQLKQLKLALPSIEDRIRITNNKISNLLNDNSNIDFFRESFDIAFLDSLISALKIGRNLVVSKNSGIYKIFFNLFYKTKLSTNILNIIEHYPIQIKKHLANMNFKTQPSEFKNADDIVHLYSQLISIFSEAMKYIESFLQLQKEYKNLQSNHKECERRIDVISKDESNILKSIHNSKLEINNISKPLVVALIKQKFNKNQISIINNYKDYLPDNIPWKYEEIEYFSNSTKSFLDFFNITCVTSLSAKSAFPLENELFDMVVVDEASQCDIASAIPLILRTKQLVVIGDPMQLRHISQVNDFEEALIKEHLLISNCAFLNYNSKSLWDYCKDLLALTSAPNNVPIMIDRHYRCHPHIIGYSNETFYTRVLGSQLKVCTSDSQFKLKPNGIIWIDVQGQQKADNINVNTEEVLKCIDIATKLATEHNNISIGIVTPFKNQAEQLNTKIPIKLRERIIADTVHKFQGDEKDVIIYSLVVTDNSPSSKIHWIDNSVPNLVNVAVTRARNTLYIVGNKEYVKNNSSVSRPLGKLVQYIERSQKLN